MIGKSFVANLLVNLRGMMSNNMGMIYLDFRLAFKMVQRKLDCKQMELGGM